MEHGQWKRALNFFSGQGRAARLQSQVSRSSVEPGLEGGGEGENEKALRIRARVKTVIHVTMETLGKKAGPGWLFQTGHISGVLGFFLFYISFCSRIDSPEGEAVAMQEAFWFALPLAVSAFSFAFCLSFRTRASRRIGFALAVAIAVQISCWQISVYRVRAPDRMFRELQRRGVVPSDGRNR
jgi:hypothetical protein